MVTVTQPEQAVSAVRLSGITKSFSSVQVLKGVDFVLQKGEVHALLGGNGAGKSTLMKILEGVYTADGGSAEIDGQQVSLARELDAHAHGIAMIFQEFSLIPTLSVAQNIFLAREPKSGGFLDDRAAERESAKIFETMGVAIDPKAQVRTLSTGSWQLTEIAKALSQNARVLIMDEPTASLTGSETRALFEIIRTLKAQGIAVVYISHRMEEIFEVADRVTVLRDGRNIGTHPVSNVTMAGLIEAIIGKKVETTFSWHERTVDRGVAPLLQVINLQAAGRLNGVSLTVYPGEIVGLAGLMGSGRTELARALFGVDRLDSGEIRLRGQTLKLTSPQKAIEAGICLIPEDRREQGLVLDHSVKSNLMLPLLPRLSQHGLVDDGEGRTLSESLVERLAIRTDSVMKKTRLLSGGNQQKIVIAKWLAAEPDLLIMDEPTAGVDIGAKGEIVALIRELADAGKGVVVISSELPELLAVSDRILVMREGAVEQSLERRDIRDESQLQQILHKG